MKKKFFFLVLCLGAVLSLSSCSWLKGLIVTSPTQSTTETTPTTTGTTPTITTNTTSIFVGDGYKITYENNNGTVTYAATNSDKKVVKPSNPTKDNATFLYWCSDEELTNEFDFNKAVNKDTTIYAKYEVDFKGLTNSISSSVLKANVKITQTMKTSRYTAASSQRVVSGSGVIFYETSSYYYVLTNNHVVSPETGFDERYSTYEVVDCYGTKYSNSDLIAKAVNSDLALVRFAKMSSSKNLHVIKLAHHYYKGEDVVALGEPKGLNNVITYGDILRMYDFQADPSTAYLSNVNFSVIAHSAFIDNGSSGGALLDTNLELVGINFASAEKNGEYQHSYAIPLEKVKEFIRQVETDNNVSFNLF